MGALAPLFTCHPPSNTYQWCYNLRSRTTNNFKIYSPPLCNSWLMYTTINSATHHMHVPYLPSIRQDTANTAHTTTVTATAVLPCAQSNMSNQTSRKLHRADFTAFCAVLYTAGRRRRATTGYQLNSQCTPTNCLESSCNLGVVHSLVVYCCSCACLCRSRSSVLVGISAGGT